MSTWYELQADIRRKAARRRAVRVALLRAMGGAPRPFLAPCQGFYEGRTVVVHRDTYEETVGQWRCTIFDARGPAWHKTFASWSEAVDDAMVSWGAQPFLARDLRTESA